MSGGDRAASGRAKGSEARHRAREVALQALYALDLVRAKTAEGEPEPEPEATFESVADHFEMPKAAAAFARELLVEVTRNRQELDRHIAASALNWRLDRMAVVDRNILRLATYELLHTDTPAAVVLDEAVELARSFAGDNSPGFVNGVLDAVARAAQPAREARP